MQSPGGFTSGSRHIPVTVQPGSLQVVNESGSVRLSAGESDQVLIAWSVRPDDRVTDWREWSVTIRVSEDAIEIEPAPPRGAPRFPGVLKPRAPYIDMAIEVPLSLTPRFVDLSIAAGDILIAGIAVQRLVAMARAGDITISGFAGNGSFQTTSGAISVDTRDATSNLPVSLELSTRAGDIGITAGAGTAGAMTARSGAGSLRIAAENGASITLRALMKLGAPRIGEGFRAAGPSTWSAGEGDGLTIEARVTAGTIAAKIIPPGGSPASRTGRN